MAKQPDDDDSNGDCDSSTHVSSPVTPKRKSPSPNTPTPGRRKASTPRRTSGLNGPLTPAAKLLAQAKNEPTLLGDFLLGRPTPRRARNGTPRLAPVLTRQTTLDEVKAEMRAVNVGKLRQPGKVQDRVAQWQKTNAKGASGANPKKNGEKDETVEIIDSSEGDSEVEGKLKLKRGRKITNKRPGKRKSTSCEGIERVGRQSKESIETSEREERIRSKSTAPPKRVISDSHWMNKAAKEKKKAVVNQIPKNFLQTTAMNPPVERKIDEWIKRTEDSPEPELIKVKPRKCRTPRRDASDTEDFNSNIRRSKEAEEKSMSRKTSRLEPFDDENNRVRASESPSNNDRIRLTPRTRTPVDVGQRVRPSKNGPNTSQVGKSVSDKPYDDGIRITPLEDTPAPDLSQAGQGEGDGESHDHQATQAGSIRSKKRSGRNLKPTTQARSRRSSQPTSQNEEDDTFSWTTPSPPEKSKRRNRKSNTPTESLDEIPFGNSAFSVLDMPIGAEANTIRRPPPKRGNSFAMPKVLKRVYNEGKKIVQDTVEPARAGVNQPPSIESWLKNTTEDPFIDRPRTADIESTLDVPESGPRRQSHKEDDPTEQELTVEPDEGDSGRRRDSMEKDNLEHSPVQKARETLPSIENPRSSPASGLRRSPATRSSSAPKVAKSSFKDSIFGAFKGESALKGTKGSSSPYDYIGAGLRERDMNRVPSGPKPVDGLDKSTEDTILKPSPPISTHRSFEPALEDEKTLPMRPRRLAPTTGQHRLSTIASVETFNTSSSVSSVSETASNFSETTVTQDTVLTGPTTSSLSRKSRSSTKEKSGLKRTLTKHADLMSMLSLPDATETGPGRMASIRSARSVRTIRAHLDTATLESLMREVKEDEVKYMRELNTLVDGVIPVLLEALISKSDTAVSTGLLNPLATSSTDTSLTKHVDGMGIALEQLRRLHRRIPLVDSQAFLLWAQSVHDVYNRYLSAWRTGFENIVVNLAPSANSTLAEDALSQDKNGDVVGASGERVDVAFLLKRPLVRVKYLHKAIKGVETLKASALATRTKDSFSDLELFARRRVKEEGARKEDEDAYNTDPTSARDLQTLGLLTNTKIDRTRQVKAKDYFSLDMSHSNGQRIECRVELVYRDTVNDPHDADILIRELDDIGRCLLFPPVMKQSISARKGDTASQLVIMIRGLIEEEPWHELVVLDAEEDIIAEDWLDILGNTPVPPQVVRNTLRMDPDLASAISGFEGDEKSVIGVEKATTAADVPLGERCRSTKARSVDNQDGKERLKRMYEGARKSAPMDFMYKLYMNREEELLKLGEMSVFDVQVLNEALAKSKQRPLDSTRRPPSTRYVVVKVAEADCTMSGALESPESQLPRSEDQSLGPIVVEKFRPSSPTCSDGAPPPPKHTSPVTPQANALKNVPALDSPTPKGRTRRTSSPLKHEYQPSEGSATSPTQEDFPSSDDYDSEFSESDDELGAVDSPDVLPPSATAYQTVSRLSSRPTSSSYSPSLAPSNSASQGPYRPTSVPRSSSGAQKVVALLSTWSVDRWKDICPDPCSIVITPGLIQAFKISELHSNRSSPVQGHAPSDSQEFDDSGLPRPLVSLVLTPVVTIRQSTALDIEIRSPHMGISLLKTTGMVRYRTLNDRDCQYLYMSIHKSRLENAEYIKLEQDRILNAYGNHAYDNIVAHGQRRGFFGRKKSYRAAARAPLSENTNSESAKSSSSFFKRLSSSGAFNISKSSIHTARNPPSGPTSMYTSSSGSSGNTTPRSPSVAQSGSMYSNGATVRDLGSKNLPIGFHQQMRGSSKWADHGHCFLTVMAPPKGMRQASSLNHGIEKRILVTRHALEDGAGLTAGGVLLDVVLGSRCFEKVGRSGVVCNIWEDVTGDDGRVGMVRQFGGVSGTTRKFCFQSARSGDCEWIFGLVRSGE